MTVAMLLANTVTAAAELARREAARDGGHHA
jgi:hypothetical protein